MNPDGVDDSHFLDWLEAADGTAVRDSAYLFYVLLLFAPGPLVTLLEGQFSFSRTPGLFGKAGAEYLNRRREDVSDFIPADVVENRTDFGIFERAPQRGINYAAYPATCSAMPAQRNLHPLRGERETARPDSSNAARALRSPSFSASSTAFVISSTNSAPVS